MMKVLAITQARYGSTRFPGKVLRTINGMSLLEIHLRRIQKSQLIDKIKVATTVEPESIEIKKIAGSVNIESFRGSIENVLERFYHTALPESPDWVVRLTSDCPLIDPVLIDKIIQFAVDLDLDYASNTLTPSYPDGLDVEVFKYNALKRAYNEAKLKSELEHVTPYIWKNSSFNGGKLFSSDVVKNSIDYSNIRITVDTYEDFQVIEKLIKMEGFDSPWINYVKLLEDNKDVRILNKMFLRNEGYQQSLNEEK